MGIDTQTPESKGNDIISWDPKLDLGVLLKDLEVLSGSLSEALGGKAPERGSTGLVEFTEKLLGLVEEELDGGTKLSVKLDVEASREATAAFHNYEDNLEPMTNFAKFVSFASAAYPRLLITTPFAPETWLKLRTKTLHEDSLRYPAGQLQRDGVLEHFVCVNKEMKMVIVAVRGTASVSDVMVDMDWKYEQFKVWGETYNFHKGFLKAALNLKKYDPLMVRIVRALEENRGYKLGICGHSLGGAVASILSIMLANPTPKSNSRKQYFVTSNSTIIPEGTPIECFVFGPAAAAEKALSARANGLVSCLVNGNDIVPLLSQGVIDKYTAIAKSFMTIDFPTRLFFYATSSSFRQETRNQIAELTKRHLVPPGQIYKIKSDAILAEEIQRRLTCLDCDGKPKDKPKDNPDGHKDKSKHDETHDIDPFVPWREELVYSPRSFVFLAVDVMMGKPGFVGSLWKSIPSIPDILPGYFTHHAPGGYIENLRLYLQRAQSHSHHVHARTAASYALTRAGEKAASLFHSQPAPV